jgi:transcriptional regulator with XRE-family HTH domain
MNEKLKKLLRVKIDKGISQTEIAKVMGVSQATIYKMLETDTNHDLNTLNKAAAYFQIPLSEFLEDAESFGPGKKTKRLIVARETQTQYNYPIKDPRYSRARKILKKIFQSKDETLISAVMIMIENAYKSQEFEKVKRK